MKARIAGHLLVCWLMLVAGSAQAADQERITLQQLQEMFAQMKASTPWNVDGPLLWGYFFTDPDPDPEKLKPLAANLVGKGYRLVRIYQADDKGIFWLHVEKVERHTPVTLNTRNQEFYDLAREFKVVAYDGMDAGLALQ